MSKPKRRNSGKPKGHNAAQRPGEVGFQPVTDGKDRLVPTALSKTQARMSATAKTPTVPTDSADIIARQHAVLAQSNFQVPTMMPRKAAGYRSRTMRSYADPATRISFQATAYPTGHRSLSGYSTPSTSYAPTKFRNANKTAMWDAALERHLAATV